MNGLDPEISFPRFEKTVVALVVGHSAVKAFALFIGMKIPLDYPSIVTRAKVLTDKETMARVVNDMVVVDDMSYFTHETARIYGQAGSNARLTNDWNDGAEYKALVRGAFSRFASIGVQGLDSAYVVIGTPADHYLSGRGALKESTSSVLKGCQLKASLQPIGVYITHVF